MWSSHWQGGEVRKFIALVVLLAGTLASCAVSVAPISFYIDIGEVLLRIFVFAICFSFFLWVAQWLGGKYD